MFYISCLDLSDVCVSMYSGVSAEGSGVIVEGSAPVAEEAVATPPAADSKVLETVSVLFHNVSCVL